MSHHAVTVAHSDATLTPTTLHTMNSSLDKLVDDVLIQILQALSVRAVLSLRKVSSVRLEHENGETQRRRDVSAVPSFK